jgi:hypothetical protein
MYESLTHIFQVRKEINCDSNKTNRIKLFFFGDSFIGKVIMYQVIRNFVN